MTDREEMGGNRNVVPKESAVNLKDSKEVKGKLT